MSNLTNGLNSALSNTHVTMTMNGWPATVSFLGLCGVIAFAIDRIFGHSDTEGGEDDE